MGVETADVPGDEWIVDEEVRKDDASIGKVPLEVKPVYWRKGPPTELNSVDWREAGPSVLALPVTRGERKLPLLPMLLLPMLLPRRTAGRDVGAKAEGAARG